MRWHKKVITKNKTEIIYSALSGIVFALAVLLWYFIFGKSFVWTEIEPLSAPSLLNRLFYSALVFVTIGALLYEIKIYRFLYNIFVRGLGSRELYNFIKAIIWLLLIVGVYFIVGKIVVFLNMLISFLYNILALLLYVTPPLGVTLIIMIVFTAFVERCNLSRRCNIIK